MCERNEVALFTLNTKTVNFLSYDSTEIDGF